MERAGEPIVYTPKVGESLKKYLQRYSVEETIRILEDAEKLNEFCTTLLTTRWSEENLIVDDDPAYQKLWDIINETENYNVLLHHIRILEPSRKELLNKISEYANELNNISKWCTVGRILGCSTESLSTILGLQLTGSKADTCLRMATLFGGVGIFITLAEMKISKDTFYKLMKLIEQDQKLFAPIQKWYQQSKEVENAMKNVFPFDYTSQIVNEFSDIVAGKKKFDRVSLLTKLLTGLLRKNKENGEHQKNENELEENKLNNEDEEVKENPEKLEENKDDKRNVENLQKDKEMIYLIIPKLVDFISHPKSQEICEWIFLKETHPMLVSIARMILQYYYSPLRFLVCQSVRALSPANQNLFSIPVMGRLLLNGYSLLDDFSRLWNFEVPGIYEMRNLERHLRCEMETLSRIVKTLSKNDS